MEEEKNLWNKARESVTELVGDDTLHLGQYYSSAFKLNINHLTISLARYKFISKLLRFEKEYRILELGCTEGVGSLFFTQQKNCLEYKGIDLDKPAVDWAKANLEDDRAKFEEEDFLNKVYGSFDVVISVDVIEHMSKDMECAYIDAMWENLNDDGIAVIGTPNITMDPYASPASKIAHVNLFSQERLYHLCKDKFKNVLIFNMNDEIVHTGMDPMACYMFAVCCGKKM